MLKHWRVLHEIRASGKSHSAEVGTCGICFSCCHCDPPRRVFRRGSSTSSFASIAAMAPKQALLENFLGSKASAAPPLPSAKAAASTPAASELLPAQPKALQASPPKPKAEASPPTPKALQASPPKPKALPTHPSSEPAQPKSAQGKAKAGAVPKAVAVPQDKPSEIIAVVWDERDGLPAATKDGLPAAAPKPSGPAAVFTPGLDGTMVKPLCSKCLTEADPLRLTMKSKAHYICHTCNTRITQIHRTFGCMPPQLLELSPAEAIEFWQAAKDTKGASKVKELLLDRLVHKHVESVTKAIQGSYLPLSVYQAQGFDTKSIEENCTDTQQHEILGKVYRVNLCTISRSTLEEKARTEILEACNLKSKGKSSLGSSSAPLSSVGSASASSGKRGRSPSQESASATSSRSSSSRGRRKSKGSRKEKSKEKSGKRSKTEKSKKDESKSEALKQEKALARKNALAWQKVLQATAHAHLTLQGTLSHKLKDKVAQFALDSAKTAWEKVCKLRKQAAAPEDHTAPDAKTLQSIVHDALTANATLESMLMAASAHYGGKA